MDGVKCPGERRRERSALPDGDPSIVASHGDRITMSRGRSPRKMVADHNRERRLSGCARLHRDVSDGSKLAGPVFSQTAVQREGQSRCAIQRLRRAGFPETCSRMSFPEKGRQRWRNGKELKAVFRQFLSVPIRCSSRFVKRDDRAARGQVWPEGFGYIPLRS